MKNKLSVFGVIYFGQDVLRSFLFMNGGGLQRNRTMFFNFWTHKKNSFCITKIYESGELLCVRVFFCIYLLIKILCARLSLRLIPENSVFPDPDCCVLGWARIYIRAELIIFTHTRAITPSHTHHY